MDLTKTEESKSIREQVFILLFEKSFNDDISIDDIIELAKEAQAFEIKNKAALKAEAVIQNLEAIDNIIETYLKGWNKSRISKVSLAILRLAVYEMKYDDKIPVKVSINEAVELSKIYGSDKDKSFVNGILGSFSRA